MSWRKDLVLSNLTIEEKRTILKKKQGQRINILTMILTFSFFGFFALSLTLIFMHLMGKFPQSAIIGFSLWALEVLSIYYIIWGIKLYISKKDKVMWSSIKFTEDIRKIWKEEFPND